MGKAWAPLNTSAWIWTPLDITGGGVCVLASSGHQCGGLGSSRQTWWGRVSVAPTPRPSSSSLKLWQSPSPFSFRWHLPDSEPTPSPRSPQHGLRLPAWLLNPAPTSAGRWDKGVAKLRPCGQNPRGTSLGEGRSRQSHRPTSGVVGSS